MTPPGTPLDMAFALLREGRSVDAEQVMVRELRAVEARHGRSGPAWASAQCDLGHVLLNSGQMDRAAECYRHACAGPPPAGPEAHKDHLTYRLNLGVALRMAGRLDEAEAELRRGVQERLAFYGREHAGYAFGLEALADLLLSRGDPAAAREAVEETVGNFWRNGHERIAGALALRAEIRTAEGAPGPIFDGIEQLPDEIVQQMAAAVLERTGRGDPRTGKAVLTDLAAALEARFGPDHQTTLNALSVLANAGRDLGDQTGRADAIRRVLTSYDRQGRDEDAVMAAMGLAMALSDARDLDGALRTYAEAHARAGRVGRPELSCQVLRNWGLALSEADRTADAERCLREALAVGERGADYEVLGRTRIALGLFLQHQGRLEEAASIVREGLEVMDPAHPDAVVARSHLGAIGNGQSCGCGDVGGAVAEAFRSFVVGHLPADLLARFDVRIEDNDFKITVELRREPSTEELDHLDRVIKSAHAEFRRRLTAQT